MAELKKLKISFVLPTLSYLPNGGFKIIYEYANRLTSKGFDVSLVHPYQIKPSSNLGEKFLNHLKFLKTRVAKKLNTGGWFPLNPIINNLLVSGIINNNIPDADVVFATAWQTAKPVMNLDRSKGKKFYLIQSLESWAGPKNEVIDSWKFPMKKVVISKWLLEFAKSIHESAEYIPNGLDFDKFGVDLTPEKRNKKTVLMMVSNSQVKGSKYGIAALCRLKESIPDLEVNLFGAGEYEHTLPQWMRFYKNPTQDSLRRLYNNSSIFLSPSLMEGFPLPPAEAMMCGCAVVASDIGGHREYIVNEKNALLFSPKDINKNVELLLRLIENDEYRCIIAHEGLEDIQKFKWEDSVDKFIKFISRNS